MYYNVLNKQRATALAVGLALVVLRAAPGHAAADPVACKRAVAKASATVERAKLKALHSCEDTKGKRMLPAPTECLTEAKTKPKIDKAKAALATSVSSACTGLSLTQIGWDGSGNGGHTVLAQNCSA